MRERELKKSYLDWMYRLVFDKQISENRLRLFNFLHYIDFIYIVTKDSNREADGIDLRYRFGYEREIEDPYIAAILDTRKECSVLEMMVALSVRCEEHIMNDPQIGSRTAFWFWEMIRSLGLFDMTDDVFSESKVENAIERFMYREYGPDGKGSLFDIEDCPYDLSQMEIWYQMACYLNSLY